MQLITEYHEARMWNTAVKPPVTDVKPQTEVTAQTETQMISPEQTSLKKDLFYLLFKVGAFALILLFIFTFLYGVVRYREPGMAAAIKDGDLVVYYRYTNAGYLPREVIALNYDGHTQARRVVATAGDTVDITESGLIVNGALQYEPEISQKTERYLDGVDFPLTVPEGQVFVLGDGRAGATDSRIYGCVDIDQTLGKVMTVIRRRSF